MGLDMYLHKVTYVGGQWVEEGEAEAVIKIKGKTLPIQPNRLRSVTEQVAYWRKANQIHGWFVDNCSDGVDNCRPVEVSDAQLKELLELCKYVKAHPDEAPSKLPTSEGFFFGDQEYDKWYWEDIDITIEQLEQVLTEYETQPGAPRLVWFEYVASW